MRIPRLDLHRPGLGAGAVEGLRMLWSRDTTHGHGGRRATEHDRCCRRWRAANLHSSTFYCINLDKIEDLEVDHLALQGAAHGNKKRDQGRHRTSCQRNERRARASCKDARAHAAQVAGRGYGHALVTRTRGFATTAPAIYLALLVTAQQEGLAALDGLLRPVLALDTFQAKHHLLGGLGLRA